MRTLRRKLIIGFTALGLTASVLGGPSPQPAQAMTCASNLPLGDETCAVFLLVVGTACGAIDKYCNLG